MKRKICVVTGSRADYGLLKWVMEDIRASSTLALQTVVTGMHLAPEFGLTYREIEADGFVIDRKIESLLSSDTPNGIAKSMGLGLLGFADALQDLQPDLVLLLGDRFEMLAVAAAALVARVPIAHLHGGEVTEGAFDESIRHALTKMSHLHFVAAEEYRARVVQLGENPGHVHLVGGLGVDGIHRAQLSDREELEKAIDFSFGERNLLVTFHPATLSGSSAQAQMQELLAALHEFPDVRMIFTLPNADTHGRELMAQVNDYVAAHPNCKAYASLGQKNYLSCLQVVDGVVGNSSSGLLEAPSFKKGTVNIGDRQRGRLAAESVINCPPAKAAIVEAIHRLYSLPFQKMLETVSNPYGDGGASKKVVAVLASANLDELATKPFFDIPMH